MWEKIERFSEAGKTSYQGKFGERQEIGLSERRKENLSFRESGREIIIRSGQRGPE